MSYVSFRDMAEADEDVKGPFGREVLRRRAGSSRFPVGPRERRRKISHVSEDGRPGVQVRTAEAKEDADGRGGRCCAVGGKLAGGPTVLISSKLYRTTGLDNSPSSD